MEQLIIDKMRSELFDTRLCKQDFEKYDVAQLQDTDEPFLWMVREHGTSLALIGDLHKWIKCFVQNHGVLH